MRGGFRLQERILGQTPRVSFERLVELIPDSPPRTVVRGGRLHLRGVIPEEPYIAKTAEHRFERLETESLGYAHPNTGRGIEGIGLELNPNPPKDGLRKAEGGVRELQGK